MDSLPHGRPSRTAERVARRRAAHQILDRPLVFEDPYALRILGAGAESLPSDGSSLQDLFSRSLRAFLAVRSRYAEDCLAAAVERGVRQYVILGAGLDTFAYRNPHANPGLRVFEVDHPATQAWKREMASQAGIPTPPTLTFAPVDFESQELGGGLRAAGFRADLPAFFGWLGVVPYLTEEAFLATARFIASTPPAGGVAFDYTVAESHLSPEERVAFTALASRVAKAGEPFKLFFDPAALARQLVALGFSAIEDLEPDEINARYFEGRADGLQVRGRAGRLLSAQVK
ncbi:MAG TPA: SAM-dependent methyltransferase [Bryobacteraceae bacterium]|nr:SAM-dependent methyltransferase [Bryobacteraceae bacterium]